MAVVGVQVYKELDIAAESHQFSTVQTPVDMFNSASAESHVLEYTRLPINDDAAPIETVRELRSLLLAVIHSLALNV